MITTPQIASMPEMNYSGKKILIIDDFQEMRNVFRDILRNCGADVKEISMAGTGNEAVALLKQKKFDVVLCDINLGHGKNGQQILEEAKVCGLVEPSCMWIMISAEKTSESITGAAEYQADAYLLKPVTEANLRARLTKVWAKKIIFSQIYRAIKENKYLEAINLCDQHLETDKVNGAELLRIKCDVLFISGELDNARKLLENTLAQRDFPWAKVGLAKILIKCNEQNTAKTLLEEALVINPVFLEAHDLLIETLVMMGNSQEASDALERAIKLSPNSVLRQKKLGDIAIKIGKLEIAEKAYRKSVSLGANSVLKTADAYIGLAKVCQSNEDSEEAFKVLDNLNKNFSDDGTRLKAMAVEGIIHHENGNEDKAKELATELVKLSAKEGIHPDSERSIEMARLFMVTGDKEYAISLLQNEIRNHPENNSLHEEATNIFKLGGMGEEGIKLLEASRKEAMEIMNKGVMLVSKKQYNEAIEAMRDARQAMPSNPRVLLNLAYVLISHIQKNGLTPELISEARESLFSANALSPGEPRFAQLTKKLNELTQPV